MKNLGTQAKSQFSHMKAHKGKMIGTGLGIATGVIYGVSGKKGNYVVAGFAVAGAIAGAILGGMFDTPNAVIIGTDEDGNTDVTTANVGDEDGMSNAIGRFNRRSRRSGSINRSRRINHKGGVSNSGCPKGKDMCNRGKYRGQCTTKRQCDGWDAVGAVASRPSGGSGGNRLTGGVINCGAQPEGSNAWVACCNGHAGVKKLGCGNIGKYNR